MFLDLGTVLGELDAARLAASADQDLGLDDDGITEFLRGLHGFGYGRCGAAIGNRHAVLLEELLALILQKIH